MFKVGDVVKVIKTFDDEILKVGSYGIIVEINLYIQLDVQNIYDIIIPVNENEIVKIEELESGKTIQK